jgi:hypothetical protein
MKSYLFLFALTVCGISIHAQTRTEYPIQSTKNLEIKTDLPVYIYKSDSMKVVVKTNKNGVKKTDIVPGPQGTTVNVESPAIDNSNMGSSIEIYTNNIENLTISGSTYTEIKNEFSAPQMNITLSGSSDLKGLVSADHVNITATGASDVELIGGAGSVNAVISGSSDLHLMDFPVSKMNITSTGASDAYVDVKDELNVTSTGASDVLYKNEPAKVNATVTGASEVKKFNADETDNNDQKFNYNYHNDYYDDDSTKTKRKRRFFQSPRDMFGGGRYHQDFVWMGIDLGVDGLVDMSNGFDLQPQGDYNFMEMNYWRNTHVRLNFFEWRFNLVKNVFNIVTGMGFDFQHYAFSQKIRLDEPDDYPGQTFTTPVIGVQDTVHSINRSRLAVQYFNIPLFFNLRTRKTAKHTKQFNFTFGVVGGIKTGASSRIIYTENGTDVEEEKKDDFNLQVFTATAMVRIKYSFFSIYASYQFTPMFRGQSPNLYPFTIGVTLLSW